MVRVAGQVGPTMIPFNCGHCGRAGQRKKGREKPLMFCSQKCYLASDFHAETVALANATRNPLALITKPCANCAAPVVRHASRKQKNFFCNQGCRTVWATKRLARQVTGQGYVRIFVGRGAPGADKAGHILEHRKVMQELLGRPLLQHENVHHKNGVRDDNRPGNLELWSRSQPHGQRVQDKIRWAQEFLAQYEGIPDAALQEHRDGRDHQRARREG